jgi:predicted branched-subunit amino acid permease
MPRLPAAAREGVRASLPLLVGVVPFGLVVGVAAVDAGLSPVAAFGMSVVVFAGASQLAVIELLRSDTPLLVVVITGVVVNLRMLMYSASIAPYFQRYRTRWKAVLAYFLTDQAYAVAIARYTGVAADGPTGRGGDAADGPTVEADRDDGSDAETTSGSDAETTSGSDAETTGRSDAEITDGTGVDATGGTATVDADATDPEARDVGGTGVDDRATGTDEAGRDWYYLGVAATIWAVWVVATAVGVGLGRGLPDEWGLDFAVPLVFLALLVPRLEDRSTTAAGVAAGVVALAAAGVPYHLGLPAAAVVGVAVGLAVEAAGGRGA